MKKLLFIVCLALIGCESSEDKANRVVNVGLNTMSDLEYYKDVNKDVCFAGIWVGWTAGTLTYVPCTPEIERTAHQFHSNQTVR